MSRSVQQAGPNPYLRTKVLTASPQELRLMLLDGALRFAKQARKALEQDKPDIDTSYENLSRAEKIVLELQSAIKPQHAPELCEQVSALYLYIYRLLVDTNMTRSTEPLNEAINLLTFERETWVMAMDKLAGERGGQGAAAPVSIQTQQVAASRAYSKSA
jgi:flagellar protein FliS